MTQYGNPDRVPPTGHPTWPDLALASIRAFHPDRNLGPASLRSLLAMWRWYDQLTEDQIGQVIEHIMKPDDSDGWLSGPCCAPGDSDAQA